MSVMHLEGQRASLLYDLDTLYPIPAEETGVDGFASLASDAGRRQRLGLRSTCKARTCLRAPTTAGLERA